MLLIGVGRSCKTCRQIQMQLVRGSLRLGRICLALHIQMGAQMAAVRACRNAIEFNSIPSIRWTPLLRLEFMNLSHMVGSRLIPLPQFGSLTYIPLWRPTLRLLCNGAFQESFEWVWSLQCFLGNDGTDMLNVYSVHVTAKSCL